MYETAGNIARISCCVISAALLAVLPCQGKEDGTPLRKTASVNDADCLKEMLSGTPAGHFTPDTASILFIGDVMLHASQIANAHRRYLENGGTAPADSHKAYDFTPCLQDIRDRMEAADITVANMEFTLAGAPFTGYPSFSAPDSYAEYLAACGTDVFLTANNHICDKGQDGMARTIRKYRELEAALGTRMTGSCDTEDSSSRCSPLYVRARGIRIAMINFTYGTNVPCGKRFRTPVEKDREDIRKMLAEADRNADLVIALPHWGEEYMLRHSAAQEKTAGWLAENGADIIIGTHPHVVQDCDTLHVMTAAGPKDVPVIYSLGNIISNMSAPDTQIGLMLTINAVKNPDGDMQLLTPEMTFTWCSLPGRLSDSHRTVPVKEFLDRKDEWISSYDWTKMKTTYLRVKEVTGIRD